jgi:hypothetical protein
MGTSIDHFSGDERCNYPLHLASDEKLIEKDFRVGDKTVFRYLLKGYEDGNRFDYLAKFTGPVRD